MPRNLAWKPRRVFYGWWIVIACFFISLYTGGVVFYGFTAFFEPLADKFHWSYAQIICRLPARDGGGSPCPPGRNTSRSLGLQTITGNGNHYLYSRADTAQSHCLAVHVLRSLSPIGSGHEHLQQHGVDDRGRQLVQEEIRHSHRSYGFRLGV